MKDTTTIEEIWMPIPKYEGLYEASNLGRVKSVDKRVWGGKAFYFKKGEIKRQNKTRHGYSTVALYKNNFGQTKTVHRLVARAFGIVKNESGLDINHIDGNKKNNSLSNLEACTRSENCLHAFRIGIATNNHSKKIILNTENGVFFDDVKEAVLSINKRYCKGYLRQMLTGIHPNKTNLVYAY